MGESHFHRCGLIDLARSYMQNAKATRKDSGFLSLEQSQKQLQELFRRCDGRPLWYKVVDRKSRPLYSFWKRESSAWVQPKLMAGKVLMISKYDDDWYTVIDETHLETRYIPARSSILIALDPSRSRRVSCWTLRSNRFCNKCQWRPWNAGGTTSQVPSRRCSNAS